MKDRDDPLIDALAMIQRWANTITVNEAVIKTKADYDMLLGWLKAKQ